jgi:4-amino-4-deoxy-L-arabinose transferase-like glycosyltransferase
MTTDRKIPWNRALLWLVLPALFLRILSLVLCMDDALVRWPFGDGLSYAKWALTISEGDVLGESHPVFYQAPFYPYVLAALQSVGLGFFPGPQILNLLAGSASVLLVFALTWRLFGERAAWIAGAMQAIWGPALMMELMLDKTALGLCAVAGFGYLAITQEQRRAAGEALPTRSWLWLGLCAGLLSLLRENFLLLGLAIAAWTLWAHRVALGARLQSAALILAGLLIGLLPSLTHNVVQGGAFVPTTYQSGTNFWMGNHAGAEGSYEPLYASRGDAVHEERDARRMAAEALGADPATISASRVQSWFWDQSLSFAWSEPLAFAGLQLRKLQYFVHHAEAPDTVPYASFRAGRPWFLPGRLLSGLMLPLAMLGLLAAARRPEIQLARLLALLASASVVGFYVVSRYRLACYPLLLPFAAEGVRILFAELAERRFVRRATITLGLALVPAQFWLLPQAPQGMSAQEQAALLALTRGTTLANWRADKEAAIPELRRSVRLAPQMVAARRGLARTLLHPTVAEYDAAVSHLEFVVEQLPASPESWHNLAYAHSKSGRREDALEVLSAAEEALGGKLPPISLELLHKLEERSPRTGDATEASAGPASQTPSEARR